MPARQLKFSIETSKLFLGSLEPFEWSIIEADQLKRPQKGSRKLVLVRNSTAYSLFVDGLMPFTNEFECPNEPQCPANCPGSERGANGSFISRQRRALLCLHKSSTTDILKFTCSVPCPAWRHTLPRIIWMTNSIVIL